MSGGSFNYVCHKVESEDIFYALDDLRDMETYLRGRRKHDAADEVLKFILAIETAKCRLDVMGKRIQGILFAAEWWASGDWGEEGVDEAMEKLDAST